MNNGFQMSAPKQEYVSNIPTMEPGQHIGILVRMIGLGNQETTWKGETKWSPKLQLVFEFPFELVSFKEGEEAKPRWIYANFTFVISDNSHLKKFVEGAIARNLEKSEYNSYNIGELLGKQFLVNIKHTPKADGNGVWENVDGATLISDRQRQMLGGVDWTKVIAKNDIWGFSVDDAGECFKSERFGDFGDKMRQKLLKSEQGIAFISSGGIPYTKAPESQNQAPKQAEPVQSTNPLNQANPINQEVPANLKNAADINIEQEINKTQGVPGSAQGEPQGESELPPPNQYFEEI